MCIERILSSERAGSACEMQYRSSGTYRKYTFAWWPWFVAAAKSTSLQWRSFLFSTKPNTTCRKSMTQHTWQNLLYIKEFLGKQPLFRPCICNTSCVTTMSKCVQTTFCSLRDTERQDHGELNVLSLHYISRAKKVWLITMKNWLSALFCSFNPIYKMQRNGSLQEGRTCFLQSMFEVISLQRKSF